jgi:hypothetical protein
MPEEACGAKVIGLCAEEAQNFCRLRANACKRNFVNKRFCLLKILNFYFCRKGITS